MAGAHATSMFSSDLQTQSQYTELIKSGTITSPKWKPFRGMPLTAKDRIRLNNIIWREWHMQYIYHQMPVVCQFATPLSDDVHTKPEAVVLEGKYWKRRLDTVTAEYKKWRTFYIELHARWSRNENLPEVKNNAELLEHMNDNDRKQQVSSSDMQLLNSDDFMDFSDTLFSLNQPFAFPNPKELSQFGYSDYVQPGLVPLQPNLEDFMDTLDPPLQEMMTSRIPSQVLPNVDINQVEMASVQNALSDQDQLLYRSTDYSELDLATTNMNQGQYPSFVEKKSVIDLANTDSPDPILPILSALQQNSFSVMENSAQRIVNSNVSRHHKPTVLPGQGTGVAQSQPLKTDSRIMASSISKQSHAQSTNFKSKKKISSQILTSASKQTAQKQDGFVVPQMPQRQKPRTIAPSPIAKPSPPISSTAQQSTFLAQLLTTGTYPGAILHIKKESEAKAKIALKPSTVTSPLNLLPSATLPNTPILMPAPSDLEASSPTVVDSPMVPDFEPSVLLPSANRDIWPSTSTKELNLSSQLSSALSSTFGLPSTIASQISAADTAPSIDLLGLSAGSPTPAMPTSDLDRGPYREHRRATHINAEQKRRCNIKSGFDMLTMLIPSLSHSPNAKVSKASMLQKCADYCRKLKSERTHMHNEAEILKKEIETLNNDISICQSQLPATGVPVTRQRTDQMKEMFEDYVKNRTLQNWKFWIFSIIIRGLFDSFNSMISTASYEELCRTVLSWLDQHCSLLALRPTVLVSLRHLSTSTSILSDPARLPEQATQAIMKRKNSTEL